MKIDVIGPVNPIRSGASQSNTLLCTNLAKNHDIMVYSFKRMYPKFIYPGREERYEEDRKKLNFPVEEVLDFCNPLSWIKTFFKIRKDKPNTVLVQWWTTVHSILLFSVLFLLRLFTKSKIGIYCQNVLPHNNSFINRVLTKLVLKRGHYYIIMAKSELDVLRKLIPNARARVTIDPTYDTCFTKRKLSKQKARDLIGIKGNTLLFFGFVRKYKGLMWLIKAMPHILKKINVNLLVVGEFWSDKEKYLNKIKELNLEKNIKIVDKFIPDGKVSPYFYASDLFVLPYETATHSGILQVAFGFDKPVVTTRVGGLVDFVKNNKNGFLVPPKNHKALAEAIIKFYKGKKEKRFIKYIKEKTKKVFEWNEDKEKVILDF